MFADPFHVHTTEILSRSREENQRWTGRNVEVDQLASRLANELRFATRVQVALGNNVSSSAASCCEARPEIADGVRKFGNAGVALLLFRDGVIFALEVPVVNDSHHYSKAIELALPCERVVGPFPRSDFLLAFHGPQLFTDNTLTVILPFLLRKGIATLVRVLRLCSTVLSANLVGTFLIALCLANHVTRCAHQSGNSGNRQAHFRAGFWILAGRAIFAGWLIALMVWLLPRAELAKVSIIIITYLVGLAGFDHIMAG